MPTHIGLVDLKCKILGCAAYACFNIFCDHQGYCEAHHYEAGIGANCLKKKEIQPRESKAMTKEDLISFHKTMCDRMHETLKRKNADYTGASSDPFSNFTTVELLGISSTEQGMLTRMTDKFKRVISFVQVGVLQVKDESVVDTLVDLANYCLLMAAYVEAKRKAQP